MTKREYRNYSYYFYISGIVFTGFLINALISGDDGWKKFVACMVFAVTVNMQLRLASLMRDKLQEEDSK